MTGTTLLIAGSELGRYGCPDGHPFGPGRYGAFMDALERSPVAPALSRVAPRLATRAEL